MKRSFQTRGPQSVGNVLAELMARQGYGRVRCAEAIESAWREAAGPLTAEYTRAGQVKRGALEVIVANSTLVQELGFMKRELLTKLAALLPDEPIKDLRFRVGSVE